ncbi:hypothetical protein FBU30_004656 [Linnemannia zychae]|nr:hypothetical protein FBU30_004656 [Linnemannia zychae]
MNDQETLSINRQLDKLFIESIEELSVILMERLSELQLFDSNMEIYNASNIEVDDQASGGYGDEDGRTIGEEGASSSDDGAQDITRS